MEIFAPTSGELAWNAAEDGKREIEKLKARVAFLEGKVERLIEQVNELRGEK